MIKSKIEKDKNNIASVIKSITKKTSIPLGGIKTINKKTSTALAGSVTDYICIDVRVFDQVKRMYVNTDRDTAEGGLWGQVSDHRPVTVEIPWRKQYHIMDSNVHDLSS